MGGSAGKAVDLIARLRRYRERLAAEQRHSDAALVDEAIAQATQSKADPPDTETPEA